jgi:septal ring factor EnvC (AmiA/AmiB activator)
VKPFSLLFLLLIAAAPPPQQLQDAERARAAQIAAQHASAARAAAAQAEAKNLAAQRVRAASRLRDVEGATADAATRVQDLAGRQRAAQARLTQLAADMAPLLPLIERLSLYPAETLLAVPVPPEQAVRGVLVLGGITGRLEKDAAALRQEQADLAVLQTRLDAELPKLAAARAVQAKAEAALDAQIAVAQAQWTQAEAAGAEAARRAAMEAARADSLRAAIARLDADRRASEAARGRRLAMGPGLGAPRGQLATPVAGTVTRGFGVATDAGPTTGISYQAAPGARVVSPCAGRAVFAGPFRSFGLLLIVDCGDDYHIVLSGFDRLDARVGQSLQAGEPVGVMPDWNPRTAVERPLLYVELRQGDQPVNPAPFLRAKS